MNLVLMIILSVEASLIVSTTFALTLPRSQSVKRWLGLSLMAVTFCWSIVTGVVLAIHKYQTLQGW